MKKNIVLVVVVLFTVMLSSCSMIGDSDVFVDKYCEENPNDQGCINGEEPTGILDEEDPSCEDGYTFEDDECVLITDEPIVCDDGFKLVDDACVIDSEPITCEEGYHEEEGSCVEDASDNECSPGFHKEGDLCVEDVVVITCEVGYHVEEESCVQDVNLHCPLEWEYGDGECVRIWEHLNCEEGYHEENGTCALNTVVCEPGEHEYLGTCVLNETVCGSDYCYYEGECWNSCELPIDHPEYAPCYTECYDDQCNYYSYELNAANSTFEYLKIWIDERLGQGSFQIHYILNNETTIIVETGPIQIWDTDKIFLRGGRATIETPHVWNFEFDEAWNLTLIDVYHQTGEFGNEETVYDNYQIFSVNSNSE